VAEVSDTGRGVVYRGDARLGIAAARRCEQPVRGSL
jgi:hypothetical protein